MVGGSSKTPTASRPLPVGDFSYYQPAKISVSFAGPILGITLEYLGVVNLVETCETISFSEAPHSVFLKIGDVTGNLKRAELPIPTGDDFDSEVLCAINCAITKLKCRGTKVCNVRLSCGYKVIRDNFDLVVNYVKQNHRLSRKRLIDTI